MDFGFVLNPGKPPVVDPIDPGTDGNNDGNDGTERTGTVTNGNGSGTGNETGNGSGTGNETDNGSGNGGDSDEKPAKNPVKDNLAATGFAALGALVGGLLLILGGVMLVRRRARGNES